MESSQGEVTLTIIDGAFSDDNALEAILGVLNNEYMDFIINGNYSRTSSVLGGWWPFKDEEQIELSL